MILKDIDYYSSEKNSIKLTLLNKYFYNKINIEQIKNMKQKHVFNKKLLKIKVIIIKHKVNNLNNFINLRFIDASNKILCTSLMKKLTKIEKLYGSYIEFIQNVNHMKNLKVLVCDGYSNIDQNGIKKLKCLRELLCNDNHNITNVNHMSNLKILHCEDTCGIDQDGINKLYKLKKLYCMSNTKINNVNHITKLRKLLCSFSGIKKKNNIIYYRNMKE